MRKAFLADLLIVFLIGVPLMFILEKMGSEWNSISTYIILPVVLLLSFIAHRIFGEKKFGE